MSLWKSYMCKRVHRISLIFYFLDWRMVHWITKSICSTFNRTIYYRWKVGKVFQASVRKKRTKRSLFWCCFPSQFNRSIRDTIFFFNETQICCSLIKIMRHVFFLGRKNFFWDLSSISFLGLKSIFSIIRVNFFFNCL